MLIQKAHISNRKDPINLTPAEEYLFQNAKQVNIPDIELIEISNVSILKNYLFKLSSLSFFTSLSHILPVPARHKFKKLSLFFLPSEVLDSGIWITDEWSSEYFHWFTDALSRWLVAAVDHSDLPVILPKEYSKFSYIQETLEILGIKPFFYNKKRRLLVKELVVSSHVAPTGNYDKNTITQIRSRFSVSSQTKASKNIYISRALASKRKVINEMALIKMLKGHHFEIHYAENYSIKQKIELLANAKYLLGLHGAGLTNMLFMPFGSTVIELRTFGDFHNNAFYALASDLDLHYVYFQCVPDGPDLHTSNVTVDIEALNFLLTRTIQVI